MTLSELLRDGWGRPVLPPWRGRGCMGLQGLGTTASHGERSLVTLHLAVPGGQEIKSSRPALALHWMKTVITTPEVVDTIGPTLDDKRPIAASTERRQGARESSPASRKRNRASADVA
jgi:hypothetical protein